MVTYYANPKTRKSKKLLIILGILFFACALTIGFLSIQKTAPPEASTINSSEIVVEDNVFVYTMLYQDSSDRMGIIWVIILAMLVISAFISFYLLKRNFAIFFITFALAGILLVTTSKLSTIPVKQEVITGEQLYNALGYTLPADNLYPEYSELEELANTGESLVITVADATKYQLLDYEITAQFLTPEEIGVTHTLVGPSKNKELLESYFLSETSNTGDSSTTEKEPPAEEENGVEDEDGTKIAGTI